MPRGPALAALSAGISRLAGELAALVAPPPPALLVRQAIALRRAGRRFLPGLAEPARDLLLALYLVQLEGEGPERELCPSSAAVAADVPHATAIVWLKEMTARGLVARRVDPADRRILRLALTPRAVAEVEAYLAAIANR